MHIDSTRAGFEGNSVSRLRRKTDSYNGPLVIDFESDNQSNEFLRGLDHDAVAMFNSKIRSWSYKVKAELQASIQQNIDLDKKLSKSIKSNFFSQTKKNTSNDDFEIDKLGFSFRKEGVYVELGVGSGYYRSGGQTLRRNDIKSIRRNPPPKPRLPHVWFNPVIDRNIDELTRIVSEYSTDLVINSSRIYIQS